MTGRRYSADDDAAIVRLYDSGLSPTAIGQALKRSTDSIESRMWKLGIERKRQRVGDRSGYRWSKAEVDVIRANRGANVSDLAALLPGRSAKAIEDQTRKMFGQSVFRDDLGRPLGTPFQTSSGAWAIRLASGVVPYVPTIHAHLHGGPLDRARISQPLS